MKALWVFFASAIVLLVFIAMALPHIHVEPRRSTFTLYSDEWTCTKPTNQLDDLGRVECGQYTAKP